MHGTVDMVRLSPMGNETFAMLEAFRANENGAAPLDLTSNSDCNGYWKRLRDWCFRPDKPLTLLTTVLRF